MGRAQQRRALPEPPPGLVVALRGGDGIHQSAPRALRTQAQVHAPDHAISRGILERAHRAPHDAGPEVVAVDLAAALVSVVHEDDVHVGAGVELPAAELAHAQHHQRAGLAVGAQGPPVALGVVVRGLGEGHLEGGLRQLGQLPGGDLDVRATEARRPQLSKRDAHLLGPHLTAQVPLNGFLFREVAHGGQEPRHGVRALTLRSPALVLDAPEGRELPIVHRRERRIRRGEQQREAPRTGIFQQCFGPLGVDGARQGQRIVGGGHRRFAV